MAGPTDFHAAAIVRWHVVGPAHGALLWFDEERAQEMFCSTVATKMFSRLEVKVAPRGHRCRT